MEKKQLSKEDYYGHYSIDKDFFPGKQANWQYDHYRFEITDRDSIFFYITDKEKIVKTFRGTISSPVHFQSARLSLNMEDTTCHILASDPTVYREPWNFYLVFNSP
ncbi:MAG: hypothetical protein ACYC1Q_00645, partial [Bacteroidia bacterium]